MRSALIIIALLVHGLTFAEMPIVSGKPAEQAIAGAPQISAAATRVKFQPQHDASPLNTAQSAAPPLQAAPNPAAAKDAREAEGLSWGTWLAALALMVAIAFRRSRAEKP
jgi:hypothetical protein